MKAETKNSENGATLDNEVAQTKSKLKKANKIDPNEMISCRSVTNGELNLLGKKTGIMYKWADYGDSSDVEFQDLQALQSMGSPFLTEPYFIIENDEVVENWSKTLKPIYDKIAEVDLNDFFMLSAKTMKARLKVAPNGLKEAIKGRAATKITNGEIDSLSVIKAIDEMLGTDLMSLVK